MKKKVFDIINKNKMDIISRIPKDDSFTKFTSGGTITIINSNIDDMYTALDKSKEGQPLPYFPHNNPSLLHYLNYDNIENRVLIVSCEVNHPEVVYNTFLHMVIGFRDSKITAGLSCIPHTSHLTEVEPYINFLQKTYDYFNI